jgi:ATP-dependent helicase/nuclease subunit A
MSLIDSKEREQALDIKQSFIIQAPAGAGKTELLTQRFLALLANAKQAPEEIIAITFTRKAAAEMRTRILEALKLAEKESPKTTYETQSWQLARRVLARNQYANWNLLQNPNRLRILTIDALCARLTKLAPIVSHFGSSTKIVDDATPFYYQAAQLLLTQLEEDAPWTPFLEKLLLHLDNNFSLVEDLFVGMLRRRDQWLTHIISHNHMTSRQTLERGLQNLIVETLNHTAKQFSPEEKDELLYLVIFAAHHLKNAQIENEITHCLELKKFPEASISQIKIWKGIAQLLLTQSYDWRKSVNKNCGFPAASEAVTLEEKQLFKVMKNSMLQLLTKLSGNEALRLSLKEIVLLPTACYSEKQWDIVHALIALLPVLVAQLHLVFREKDRVDFIAIAEGAIQALGEGDNPSDLALNLDYKIQHLLVDEFQDTSLTQFRLLELLTAGWEPNDGRTLFLVGDPMQSIYRFREAEVGIFLKVKMNGLNNIKLKPLTLKVNFRSASTLVTWFNQIFKHIFPKQENCEIGAIPFSPSAAFFEKDNSHVKIHAISGNSNEVSYIIDLIKQEITHNPEKSIAILVRSRSHLQLIIPELKKENIPFEAIEIEKLIYSPTVRDLYALTRAIMHPGDKIAWLAVLRAPWCGLNLHDLYHIANFNPQTTIWQTIKTFSLVPNLSLEAIKRLTRVVPLLEHAIHGRARKCLRQEIAYTWYALGGPACLNEEHEIKNAEAYLQLLENFDRPPLHFQELERALSTSYSHHISSNAKIHLMTIHKAKGLEFDIVIIPSLEKKPRQDENPLLMWLERQNQRGESDLILAPIKSLDEEFDPIYRYVSTQQILKAELETARLLYVAVTRSRQKLHLIGKLSNNQNSEEFKAPISGSFLHLLWPILKDEFKSTIQDEHTNIVVNEENRFLTRLPLDWRNPSFLPSKETPITKGHYSFNWSPHYLDHVGKIIHEYLERISQMSIENLRNMFSVEQKLILEKKLFQLGVTRSQMEHALYLIEKAISQTLQDPRGQWILSNHLNAKSEFPLTAIIESEIVHYTIDRTFIDNRGFRWIIDYKTGDLTTEEENSLFIKAKLYYGKQLENYAKAFRLLEDREIKLGIYFPLFSGWCEWDFLR